MTEVAAQAGVEEPDLVSAEEVEALKLALGKLTLEQAADVRNAIGERYGVLVRERYSEAERRAACNKFIDSLFEGWDMDEMRREVIEAFAPQNAKVSGSQYKSAASQSQRAPSFTASAVSNAASDSASRGESEGTCSRKYSVWRSNSASQRGPVRISRKLAAISFGLMRFLRFRSADSSGGAR